METNSELGKQQLKSKATKQRIFHAAKKILQEQGYESLSLKNICKEAGVSNGSFYHHFDSKEDLLSFYIEEQPVIDANLLEIPSSADETKETIILVYLNYAAYCRELGARFIENYYTPKNQALNPTKRTERSYPIVTVRSYLENAIAANVIVPSLAIEEITTDIRMLIIGNVFEWCLRPEVVDFEGNIRRSLGQYLKNIF
jgi:Transcriptional regulator